MSQFQPPTTSQAGLNVGSTDHVGQMTASASDRLGQILGARYWLRRRLLKRYLGDVYQAHDLIENRAYSVKLVRKSAHNAVSAQSRLQHEAAILAQLDHPNIIHGYGYSQDEYGNFFVTMEPLDGCSLDSLLVDGTPVVRQRALTIVAMIGEALQHAHSLGIVHQDIKPESIFLHHEPSPNPDKAPAAEVVKVMNFGLSRQLNPEGPSPEYNLIDGTPMYMAPEALLPNGGVVDGRADQWSLAVLACQLLTGRMPYWYGDADMPGKQICVIDPKSLPMLMPGVAAHVIAALQRALSHDKESRFPQIQDFVEALRSEVPAGSRQTLQCSCIGLIEKCRPCADAHAHSLTDTQTTTRQYPVLSFPAQLLASVDDTPSGTTAVANEQSLEAELLTSVDDEAAQTPAPAPIPARPAATFTPIQRHAGRGLVGLGCFVLALFTAPLIAPRVSGSARSAQAATQTPESGYAVTNPVMDSPNLADVGRTLFSMFAPGLLSEGTQAPKAVASAEPEPESPVAVKVPKRHGQKGYHASHRSRGLLLDGETPRQPATTSCPLDDKTLPALLLPSFRPSILGPGKDPLPAALRFQITD